MDTFYTILPNSASTFLSICNNRNPKHTRSVYHYITVPYRTIEPNRTVPNRTTKGSYHTMSLPNDTMLTATEAAKLLGISEAAIRKRIKTGKLHAIKEGHTWKISAADIEGNRTVPNRTSEPYRTEPFRNPSNSRNTDLEAENTNLKDDLRKALESTQIQSEKHETEVTYLRSELSESHKRSDEARTRSDTIIMQLTQQLERTQMQLEDLRETKTLWQRVRSVFIPNSA